MLVLGSWGLGPVLVLNTGNGSLGVSAWNHLPYSSWRWWRTVPNKNSNYGAESKHTTKPEWKQLAHGTTAENQDFMLAAVSPLHAFPKYILWHTTQINARLARLYQQSTSNLYLSCCMGQERQVQQDYRVRVKASSLWMKLEGSFSNVKTSKSSDFKRFQLQKRFQFQKFEKFHITLLRVQPGAPASALSAPTQYQALSLFGSFSWFYVTCKDMYALSSIEMK